MFKIQTHPLCRCLQPWEIEVYQLHLFQQWYVFTLLHTYIVYIQAFMLRVALYPGQLGEGSTNFIR